MVRSRPRQGRLCDFTQVSLLGGTSSLTNLTGSMVRRGAGYTFGAQVVKKFLAINNMHHVLRAHQLCMEGFAVLYDDRLSTVWSAPNYCYRCGNMASILEVGPNGEKHFNVFDAAPENERDGPQQQQQQAGQPPQIEYVGLESLHSPKLRADRALYSSCEGLEGSRRYPFQDLWHCVPLCNYAKESQAFIYITAS